jgi:hypothetical protein
MHLSGIPPGQAAPCHVFHCITLRSSALFRTSSSTKLPPTLHSVPDIALPLGGRPLLRIQPGGRGAEYEFLRD